MDVGDLFLGVLTQGKSELFNFGVIFFLQV